MFSLHRMSNHCDSVHKGVREPQDDSVNFCLESKQILCLKLRCIILKKEKNLRLKYDTKSHLLMKKKTNWIQEAFKTKCLKLYYQGQMPHQNKMKDIIGEITVQLYSFGSQP